MATACVLAQGPVPGASPAAPGDATEAISGEQIPARSWSARVTLESIRARLQSEPLADTREMEEITAEIDNLRQHLDLTRVDLLPEFRINELRRQLRFYQQQLNGIESDDIARASRLSAAAADLVRLRRLWTATAAVAERDQLAKPLLEEVKRVLRQVADTEEMLDQPLAAALASRERAGRYEARLEALERSLKEASIAAVQRQFSLDAPPIWSPRAFDIAPKQDWLALQARINNQISFSRQYLRAKRISLAIFGIVLGLAFAVVLWLSRGQDWLGSELEHSPEAGSLLQRPFASLLTIAMTLLLLLSSEFTPPILLEVIVIAVLLSLLRVMPGRLAAGHYRVLLGMAVLFIVDHARTVMPYDSLAFRADHLIVALSLAVGYIYVLALNRRTVPPRGSWLAGLSVIAPYALALTLAALIANLLGNISLADLLLRGTLMSTTLTVMLFVAVLVSDGFIVLGVHSSIGRRLRTVTLRGPEIIQVSHRLIRYLAYAFWLYAALNSFHLWSPIWSRLTSLLEASWMIGELNISIGGVLTFTIAVLLAVFVSRATRFTLLEEILPRLSWPGGVKSTTATLAYYGTLLTGLVLAFSTAGIHASDFALVIGALGVGIGFGLQNVVNNFVSGLILMFERPVQPGDIIDVDTLQGQVVQIGLRATRVKTWEGAEVVVPNGTLLSGNLVNWTLSDTYRRIDLTVGVAYGSDIKRVLEILLQVARQQPAAMEKPPPVALFTGFGASSLDFVVRFWTRDATMAPYVRSEAGVAIAEALAAEGIEIPFPQQDIHLRSVDDQAINALK